MKKEISFFLLGKKLIFVKFLFLLIAGMFFSSSFVFAKDSSDIFYEKQWYLKRISADGAWDRVVNSESVIAIIDSGVQIDHPDLKNNIWVNNNETPDNGIDDDGNGYIDDVNGWDFIENNPNPSPDISGDYNIDGVIHGTVVAGIAAASGNNEIGVSGIAWKAKLMPLRVLDAKGEGDIRDVIKAIDYAINNNASIINFSFVGYKYSQKLDEAIKRAYDNNIIIVAAAGNEEENSGGNFLDDYPMYPVCNDGLNKENMVIGVAATDALDQKTSFSGFGTKCIDLSAPGVSIFSTSVYKKGIQGLSEYYDGYWSGTSMAVPQVSGAISLIESINPSLSRDELIDVLLNSTDNITKLNPDYLWQLGTGRLNVENAVNMAYSKLFINEFRIVVAPKKNSIGTVKIVDGAGKEYEKFTAYDEGFMGGVNVAVGDVDGDGISEIVTGAGNGGGPHVRVFDRDGRLKGQFFAYNENFRGGVNVAVGDVDGDGISEIVTGAGNGGGPHVRVFDRDGRLKGQFFAYNENFRGGVNVAVGDVDGDGISEIVTGAGNGGGPQVRIFNGKGKVRGQFFAFDKNLRGGVSVALANTVGGLRSAGKEIITAPFFGGEPRVKIFNAKNELVSDFYAFDKKFKGGIQLTGFDIDYDGLDEIVSAAGEGGTPHVRIFNSDASLVSSFYAFDKDFNGGVNVSFINYKN